MPATYSSRTYGKRNNPKRRPSPDRQTSSDEEHDTSTHSEASRKRRKVSPNNGLSFSHTSTPPVSKVEPSLDDESPIRIMPAVKVTYGTPRKQLSKQRSATPEPMSPSPSVVTPKKLARDLSGIFASVTPASSKTPLRKPPMKLAKRMLSRSKTEPFIENEQATEAKFDHRTPSLPNIAASIQYESQTTSHSQPSSTTGTTEDSSVIPVVPLPPVSTTNATRTYAGKSRSFLVAMPASSFSLSTSTSLNESQSQQSALEEEDDYLTRESYSSLRARWGVDDSEDDPYPLPASPSPKGKGKEKQRPLPIPLPNGMMNPLKSITELRSKGESRRFLDEVGYLFEGMARSGAIGLRRASAQEITTKLCDSDFARKARAADFFGKTWDVFSEAGAGRGEDKILDILLIFLAALVAREPSSLAELAERAPSPTPSSDIPSPTKARKKGKEKILEEQSQSPQIEVPPRSFVDTLFILLDSFCTLDPLIFVTPKAELGDAELRKAGIGKKDKVTLSSIYNLITTKSNIFASETPISTPLMIAYVLQTLPPSLLHKPHLSSLLTSLRAVISSSASSGSTNNDSSLASSLYLTWKDAPSRVAYENIRCHLQLLDTYLLKHWGDERIRAESQGQSQEDGNQTLDVEYEKRNEELDKARDEWLVGELVALGVCAELRIQSASDDEDAESESAKKCLELALRVLVSLTYSDEKWGGKVLENEYAIGWVMRIITPATGMGRSFEVKKEERDMKVKVKNEDEENIEERDIVDQTPNNGGESVKALDRLCLALGLLTNLVQVVPGAKDILRETRIDPACVLRKRACVRSCTCSNPVSVLGILSRLYAQHLPSTFANSPLKAELPGYISPRSETNPGEVDAAYLRGHLSILFGLLMRGSKQNQDTILATLPLPSDANSSLRKMEASSLAKLNMLVDQARDFVGLYAVLSSNNNTDEGEDSKIAIEVVRFLEDLRDKA